jgi:hypothetical protein
MSRINSNLIRNLICADHANIKEEFSEARKTEDLTRDNLKKRKTVDSFSCPYSPTYNNKTILKKNNQYYITKFSNI